MAIQWGPYEYSGGNGMRVGIDVTVSSVSTGSSTATLTYKVYTQNQYRYADDMQLNFGGAYDGASTYAFGNYVGSSSADGGGAQLRVTKSLTYTYPSTSYGASPGIASFSATISGAYNGVTPSKSVVTNIPARPYSAPLAQTSRALVRNDDSSVTLSWVRENTSQRPYTSQTIAYRRLDQNDAWSGYSYVSVSSTATSYTQTGLVAGGVYEFLIRANNTVGSNAYQDFSPFSYMTPTPPSSVVSAIDGGGSTITTTWAENAYTSAYVTHSIERSVNGGAWTSMATGLSVDAETWTDPAPGAGANQYRVSTTVAAPSGTATSAPTVGNTVSTIVAPLAPTNLSPNGIPTDLANEGATLTWKHNHGGDGAAQTQFSIQYSADSGATWDPLVTDVVSESSLYVLPSGVLANGATYLWRAQTQGVASEGYGPWSGSATIIGSSRPTATLDPSRPEATSITLPLVIAWTYNQDELSPQTAWEVQVVDSGSVVVGSGAGSTEAETSIVLPLVDGAVYTVRVRVRSGAGMWSNWTETTTTVDLLPPVPVDVSGEYDVCTGTVILHLDPAEFNLRQNLSLEPGPLDLTYWNSQTVANMVIVDRPWDPGTDTARITGTGAINPSITADTGWNIEVGDNSAISALVYCATQDVGVRIRTKVDGNLDGSSGTAYLIPAGTPTRVFRTQTAGAAGSLQAAFYIFDIDGSGNTSMLPNGADVHVCDVLVASGTTEGTYFDGSTPDTETAYAWDGATGLSTSSATLAGYVPIDHVSIERRVAGGRWVALTSFLQVPSDFVDALPTVNGTNTYRVTAVSTTPSYAVNPDVDIEGTGGEKGRCGLWVFVSYGEGFTNVLRVQGSPRVSVQAGRAGESHSFLGRAKPVLLQGQNTAKVVQFSGDLHYDDWVRDDDGCEYDSPPSDWETIAQESGVVCYRDYTGRRIFGRISGVQVGETWWKGFASVTFDVEETDYVEAGGGESTFGPGTTFGGTWDSQGFLTWESLA